MKYSGLMFGLCLGASLAQAAPFENLGFDLANTNTLSPAPGSPLRGTGPTEDLLPAWQLLRGTTPQPTLGFNLSLSTLGYATLISADQSDFFGFNVEGKYALHLVSVPGNVELFTLVQRGEVPAEARILTYKFSGAPLALTVNGADLQPLADSPSAAAFDISSFAGQTVDLKLTLLGPAMPNEPATTFVDSIAFGIPEPTALALMAMGTLVLCLGVRLRRIY
jgi:hypothetical protein